MMKRRKSDATNLRKTFHFKTVEIWDKIFNIGDFFERIDLTSATRLIDYF